MPILMYVKIPLPTMDGEPNSYLDFNKAIFQIDSAARITSQDQTSIAATGIERDDLLYTVFDFGAGALTDFELWFDSSLNAGTPADTFVTHLSSNMYFVTLANHFVTPYDLANTYDEGITFSMRRYTSSHQHLITDWVNDVGDIKVGGLPGTNYHVIKRTGTTCSSQIWGNPDRVSGGVSSASVGGCDDWAYQYLIVFAAQGHPTATNVTNGIGMSNIKFISGLS